MTTNNQAIKKQSSQKISKELSYMKKCKILANIFSEKKITLINSFDNIPIVKLYTADLTQENFVYSKIKGGLCFFIEDGGDKNYKYYLQIYDIYTYSLVFNIQINQSIIGDLVKVNSYFFFFSTKFYCLGFKFNSKDSMDKFLCIFNCKKEPDKQSIEMNNKAREFICDKKELSKLIKHIHSDLEKKSKSLGKESNKKCEQDKNVFAKLDDIYNLVNCIEYDEISNKFNIFIDKSFNPNIIKAYIEKYKTTKNKNSLSFRIIFNDYTHIYNKNIYIDILTNNLMNNFNEAKRLIIFKREHKKRHKEDNEESRRVNSEFNISKAPPTNNNGNDKVRNSAITPMPKYNSTNELRRTNAVVNRNKKIGKIEEVPEEDVDHLKIFNEKEKEKEKINIDTKTKK